MPPNGAEEIPGVEDDQIAATAGLIPTLPNIRADLANRFAQAVRSLVENRAQQGWPNEGQQDIAVFVMVDHPRRVGEYYGAEPFADPIATADPLLGKIFFSSVDASSGRAMLMPADHNSIIEWLEDSNMATCPFVVVHRATLTMVTRLAGTRDTVRNDRIRDREPTATLEELLDALHQFHVRQLLTPVNCPDGVWEPGQAHRYIPAPQPEKSIQSTLSVALNFWFRGTLRAEYEDTTNIGRIDIRLLKAETHGPLFYWAIVELKVIRSFTSGTNQNVVHASVNENAIVEGIRQVSSYRTNRNAEEGVLEIYDLRNSKQTDLLHASRVTSAIGQHQNISSITVRQLFGSSSDARAAGYTGT